MPRQRERFERTDVPVPSAFRNMVSAGVLVAVALGGLLIWNILWNKANQMNLLNDDALYDALYEQKDDTQPSDGRVWSDDSFTNCLVLVVDDVHADAPQLQSVQFLSRNLDAGTASIATLPPDFKVWLDEGTSRLATEWEADGATYTLPLITNAANVHVSHVIVATDKIWDQLGSFRGPTLRALLSSQTCAFNTISSDYTTGELVELGEALQAIGMDNIARIDAPSWTETAGDGSELVVIDWQELPTQLGIFTYPAEG